VNVKYGLTVNVNNNRSVLTAVKSIAVMHPDIKILVVNYTDGFTCANIKQKNVTCWNVVGNRGHAWGIVQGMCKLSELGDAGDVLVFDNDIKFVHEGFLDKCEDVVGDREFYGVGDLYHDKGSQTALGEHAGDLMYLHPYCCILNSKNFFNYRLPTDHGAPFIASMYDIYKKGKTDLLFDVNPKGWVEHAWNASKGKYSERSYAVRLSAFKKMGGNKFWTEETL